MEKRTRVLLARLGMDAHWRGSMVVARALRDNGMEVIYMGNQMPGSIVEAAIQEDVDLIGLSTLSGNHTILVPEIITLLREKGMEDMPVILGGTISPMEIPKLKEIGVKEVFGPGTPLNKIIEFINNLTKITKFYI